MARQNLVPVDGSQKSLEGLEYAVTTYSHDEITVLSVMTPHGARNDSDQLFSQTQFENWYDKARGRLTTYWMKHANWPPITVRR